MDVLKGDSYEVNIFGCTIQGFVLSPFMVSKYTANNKLEIFSYMLIDKNNAFVIFRPTDIIHTTRIVLTEKTKLLPKNINKKVEKAKLEFYNRQYYFRRIGMTSTMFLDAFIKSKEKNFTIITGKSR